MMSCWRMVSLSGLTPAPAWNWAPLMLSGLTHVRHLHNTITSHKYPNRPPSAHTTKQTYSCWLTPSGGGAITTSPPLNLLEEEGIIKKYLVLLPASQSSSCDVLLENGFSQWTDSYSCIQELGSSHAQWIGSCF